MRTIEIHIPKEKLEFYKERPWLYEDILNDLIEQFEIDHKSIHYISGDIRIDIFEERNKKS